MVIAKIRDNIAPKNPKNETIVAEFRKLIEQIKYDINNALTKNESMTNYYRLKQITNVLDILLKFSDEIKSGEQLKGIKGVGKGSIDRINEIIKSGKLKEVKLKNPQKEYLNFIEELENIIGIGRKTAHELVKKYNIKSIDELKKAYRAGKIHLNDQILLGLKYYGVYQQQIPREEVDKISDYVGTIIRSFSKDVFHTICGSYRRKKPTSNDIDILIANPKVVTPEQFSTQDSALITLITTLKEERFLLDDLTDKEYEIKYMGFCQLTDKDKKYPIRRIDIRYVPYESYYSALLYFTGSGDFNRKMRLLAKELNYKLSEYGLYKLKNGKEIRIKNLNSEEAIFEKLGLEFIVPEKRI